MTPEHTDPPGRPPKHGTAAAGAESPPPEKPVRVADAGYLLVFTALAAFAYELIVGLEAGAWRIIPVGELWFDLHVGSLNFVQAIVQRYIHPWLWDPVLSSILQWPAWSLLGGPGAILLSLYASPRVDPC